MPVTIELALAKTHKFATRESGDTAEIVERPGGGVSVVIVDGQGSGSGAKRLSLMVAGKVVGLLSDGVRDGVAARAAHDFLYAQRGGRVSAALDIVSADLASRTLLLTRNSEVPLLLLRDGGQAVIEDSGGRIGIQPFTRPRVLEYPAVPGLTAVIVTDGVAGAGARTGARMGLAGLVDGLSPDALSCQELADVLIERALARDQGRPADDMTVVVIRLGPSIDRQPVRRLSLSVPLQG